VLRSFFCKKEVNLNIKSHRSKYLNICSKRIAIVFSDPYQGQISGSGAYLPTSATAFQPQQQPLGLAGGYSALTSNYAAASAFVNPAANFSALTTSYNSLGNGGGYTGAYTVSGASFGAPPGGADSFLRRSPGIGGSLRSPPSSGGYDPRPSSYSSGRSGSGHG
jgi:hypothetical protein